MSEKQKQKHIELEEELTQQELEQDLQNRFNELVERIKTIQKNANEITDTLKIRRVNNGYYIEYDDQEIVLESDYETKAFFVNSKIDPAAYSLLNFIANEYLLSDLGNKHSKYRIRVIIENQETGKEVDDITGKDINYEEEEEKEEDKPTDL